MEQQAKGIATFDDFTKLDIRVAKVLAVRDHPNADKLVVMDIDLGTQQRQIIAGLKDHCTSQSLVGKNVVVLINLEPRKMRGLESNGMLLAATAVSGDSRRVVVLTPAEPVPPGSAIS